MTVLAVALAGLVSGCLPDQLDGRQEGAAVDPALDLSWFDDTSALDVIDAGLTSMAEIGSVRLHQDAERRDTETPGDAVVSKDLRLVVGDGIGDAVDGDCTGTLQLPSWGTPAELVVEDGLGAFRGDAEFWSGFGGDLGDLPTVREVLADTYAERWTTTPGLASLCTLAEFLDPVASVVGDDQAVKAGLGDVAGVPAGRVVSTSAKRTVTTWVQVEEPHLVLKVVVETSTGDGDGAAGVSTVNTFSDVDAAVEVDFPAAGDIIAFELPTQSSAAGPTPTPTLQAPPAPVATPVPAAPSAPASPSTPSAPSTPTPPGPSSTPTVPSSTPAPTATPGPTSAPTPSPSSTPRPTPTPEPGLPFPTSLP